MFTRRITKYNNRLKETILGDDANCQGKITSISDIRIEGQFEGEIECEGTVTVGERSKITSNISAQDVIIAGEMTGDLLVKGKLILLHSGVFTGQIFANAIVIHEGGIFQGTSNMKSGEVPSIPNQLVVVDTRQNTFNKLDRDIKSII